jgi:hypothetical protein
MYIVREKLEYTKGITRTHSITRVTPKVQVVEQELVTLPVFCGVHDAQSLFFSVFVDHCLSFCLFFLLAIVLSVLRVYVFWLSLWYLQTIFEQQDDYVCKTQLNNNH